MRLILLDANPVLVKAWRLQASLISRAFRKHKIAYVEPSLHFINDTLEGTAGHQWEHDGHTALVTPGNSLAYMGGGFDKYVVDILGKDGVAELIQQYTLNKYRGYVPVGEVNAIDLALVFPNYTETAIYSNLKLVELVVVPSMVVPEPLAGPQTLFDSVWNVLRYADLTSIENWILPGIGTGCGNVDASVVAETMVTAIYLFHMKASTRRDQLKRSVLVLNFLNKDYRKFGDVADIESVMSEHGKQRGVGSAADIDELLLCINP